MVKKHKEREVSWEYVINQKTTIEKLLNFLAEPIPMASLINFDADLNSYTLSASIILNL